MQKPTKQLRDIHPDAKGLPWHEWQLKYGHRLRTEAERIDDELQAARIKTELKFGETKNGKKRR